MVKRFALHVFNVYEWVASSEDSPAKNDALALEMREEVGGLGRVPWVVGGGLESYPRTIW